jgi:ABC-2 type transport system permease protein
MLYFKLIRAQVKSQTQKRSSFAFLILGQLVVPLFSLAGVIMLFDRFGSIGGWTRAEALLCFGVTHIAFATAVCFARGFDVFSSMVLSGEFDRILARPRGTVLQVLGQRFDLSRVGRLVLGCAVLAWSMAGSPVRWDVPRLVTVAAMVASGSFIFSGIMMLGAALSFRTIQGLEVVNIFTDGGRETSQYPLSIYPEALKSVFTFIIPFACFNYIPLLWILGKPGGHPILGPLAPWAGMLFVLPCVLVWRAGVRSYLSTGS